MAVFLNCLLQIRQLFTSDAEPSYFLQYCCHWLLPALILHDESHSELTWLAQVGGNFNFYCSLGLVALW